MRYEYICICIYRTKHTHSLLNIPPIEPSPISFRYPQTPTGKKRARQTNVSLFNDLILTNNNNNNHNHNHNHNNNNHNHNHNNRGSRPSSFGGGGLFGIAERGSSLHSPSTTPTSSPSSCQKSSPCAFLGPSAENEFLSREVWKEKGRKGRGGRGVG